MRKQKSNEDKPEVTYHYCQITGFGTRMIPPLITELSRMGGKTERPGYLVGYVNTRSQEFRVRNIDLSKRVQPSDRVYYSKELPRIEDHSSIILRMMEECTLLEERIIIKDFGYDSNDKKWYPRISLAPRDFQMPTTISESTQPENVAASIPEETAPPLEVSLGELVKSKSKYMKKKDLQREEQEK